MTKICMILALIASLTNTNPSAENQELCMRAMEIVQLDYNTDTVYCVDAVGLEWAFFGCEDYNEGDLITALMWNNGTCDTILDDVILDTEYSGYWFDYSEDFLNDGTRTWGR